MNVFSNSLLLFCGFLNIFFATCLMFLYRDLVRLVDSVLCKLSCGLFWFWISPLTLILITINTCQQRVLLNICSVASAIKEMKIHGI